MYKYLQIRELSFVNNEIKFVLQKDDIYSKMHYGNTGYYKQGIYS